MTNKTTAAAEASEPEVGWSKAMRKFLVHEYNKEASTPAQIARQREIGALLDSFDRKPK